MPSAFKSVQERLLDWGRPTPQLEELHPQIKDDVFRWQLGGTDFTCIDAETLLRADICRSKSVAEKVLNTCHGLGIIDPATGQPATSKVDRSMVNKLATISARKQRELVLLLFFMEEEITRWRLLSNQEDEIKSNVEGGGLLLVARTELEMSLKLVQAQKNVAPSLRDASGRMLPVHGEERLPEYEEAARRS
jgi:hypothetical protein